jgi:hypothetical protein
LPELKVGWNCNALSLFLPTYCIFFSKTDTEFFTTKGVPAQILYLIFATSLVRLKYYHAWLLADAIANASGLGLRVPATPKEKPSWDLISNIDVIAFEVRKQQLNYLLYCWLE